MNKTTTAPGRIATAIMYVCPCASDPSRLHILTMSGNETEAELERIREAGFFKAHVVAIEVADEKR